MSWFLENPKLSFEPNSSNKNIFRVTERTIEVFDQPISYTIFRHGSTENREKQQNRYPNNKGGKNSTAEREIKQV